MAALVASFRGDGVLGFDIAGDERYPLAIHRGAIEFCLREGLYVTVHAGEKLQGEDGTLGSILENLRLARELGVHRIGHGFCISLDDHVCEMFRARDGVCVEVCLTAVTPYLVASGEYRDHPIKTFLEKGIACSISSDNLRLAGKGELGTSSSDELMHLASADGCGLSWSQVREVLMNGVRSSFLPEGEEKRALVDAFARDLDDAMRANGLL